MDKYQEVREPYALSLGDKYKFYNVPNVQRPLVFIPGAVWSP